MTMKKDKTIVETLKYIFNENNTEQIQIEVLHTGTTRVKWFMLVRDIRLRSRPICELLCYLLWCRHPYESPETGPYHHTATDESHG